MRRPDQPWRFWPKNIHAAFGKWGASMKRLFAGVPIGMAAFFIASNLSGQVPYVPQVPIESRSREPSVSTELAGCDDVAGHLGKSPGYFDATGPAGLVSAPGIRVRRGKQRCVIDALGCMMGIPDKLLLWNRGAKNHQVSSETVSEIVDYLQFRDLRDVTVRVNQYDPVDEWNCLVENDRVAAPWKYTIGLLKQAKYIFLPGRIFGRDEYNPYTNTLSLYSDMPSLGLAEAAYAQDVHHRCLPGTYATAQMFPPLALWHETLATDEVLHYLAARGSLEQETEMRRGLYARYGMHAGGEISAVLPDGSYLYTVGGAVVGHTLATLQELGKRR